jgi:hypothetical protein
MVCLKVSTEEKRPNEQVIGVPEIAKKLFYEDP